MNKPKHSIPTRSSGRPPLDRFDADPEKSWAMPSWYYYDAEIAAREKDAIFADSWQYAGHAETVARPGEYVTREIAGESIFIIRGHDRVLRAFYNVCSHRAHQLLNGAGQTGAIVCPYHAWTYGLDGALTNARNSENVADFEAAALCLKPLRVEVFVNLVFVNLNPDAAPLHGQLGNLEAELRSFAPQLDFLTLTDSRQYKIEANWKNIMENYAECYHCPGAHPDFAQGVVELDSYRVKTFEMHHAHTSHARTSHAHTSRGKPPQQGGYKIDTRATERGAEFGSWFIWPNLAIEVYPGGNLNIFHCAPCGPESSVQTIEWYFQDSAPTPSEAEIIEHLHRTVRLEDVALCESVQRGFKSRAYHQGRLIVDKARSDASEHSVHHFQSLVRRALGIHP